MLDSSAFLLDPASWASKLFSDVLDSFFVSAVLRAAFTGSNVDAGIPSNFTRATKTSKPRVHRRPTLLFVGQLRYLRAPLRVPRIIATSPGWLIGSQATRGTYIFWVRDILTNINFGKKHQRKPLHQVPILQWCAHVHSSRRPADQGELFWCWTVLTSFGIISGKLPYSISRLNWQLANYTIYLGNNVAVHAIKIISSEIYELYQP